MKDQSKTKPMLIQELAALRQRIEDLEQSESNWKEEKEELKKSESRFRSYFDLTLYGIAITSPEKGWIQVNDRLCSIMGYSRDEIVRMTWSEMTHPDDLAADLEQFSRVLSGQIDQYNMKKRFIRKDGKVVWTNLSVGCVRKPDGSVDHIVAMVEDITSNKLAEEALSQEQKLYEDLVTTQPAGVYRLRVKLRGDLQAGTWRSMVKSMYSVDLASDQYCKILGISHEEFVTNPGVVPDLVHPDDKQDFDVKNTQALTSMNPFTWEGRIIRDHQTRWVHFESLPRMLDPGTAIWTGIVYDITERKAAEEALKETNETLGAIIQSSPLAIIALDPDGNVMRWNPAAEQMFGWLESEVFGQFLPIVSEDKRDEHLKLRERVLRGEGFTNIEARRRRKDGSPIDINISTAPLRDSQGRVTGIISVSADITERKRAEEAQRESEETMRYIIKHDPNAIAVYNLDLHYIAVSDRYLQDYNVKEADIIGKHHYDVFPEMPQKWKDVHQRCLSGAIERNEDDYFERPDGSITYNRWECRPWYRANGKIGGIITYTEVTTERKQAEAKINQMNAELEQRVVERTAQLEIANKEMEAFTYSVSHDLKAPLRAVDGYAQILIEDHAIHLDAEGRRVCEVISKNARMMGQLIDDLLAFSRIGRAEMQQMPVDMAAQANAVFFELTTPEERKRIDFRVAPLPRAIGDPQLLRQVWMNLLGNAVKFSAQQERTVIEVGFLSAGSGHPSADGHESGALTEHLPSAIPIRDSERVYFVRDNGVGFDMAYVDKLFGVFQRLHSAKEFEGTGVGLAIVQRIVQRHGGRTWAEGKKGKGATFYFSIGEA